MSAYGQALREIPIYDEIIELTELVNIKFPISVNPNRVLSNSTQELINSVLAEVSISMNKRIASKVRETCKLHKMDLRLAAVEEAQKFIAEYKKSDVAE